MTDCEDDGAGECRLCGEPMPGIGVRRNCSSVALTDKRRLRLPRYAVGDAVESALTKIGISKELVANLTERKDCGCDLRKQWLNNAGYRVQAAVENAANAVADWYFW